MLFRLPFILVCLLALSPASFLLAETARAGVDLSQTSPSGWSVDNPALWETGDSLLKMTVSTDSTGRWLKHYVRLDSARTDGDFTVHATAGFSGAAYPMENDSAYSWKIYYRAMAFGIMADSANALLATFCRTNGRLNGLLRLKDGKEIWLHRPYSGQGVGLDVHDLREYRMTRAGRKIIVAVGNRVAYVAEDTVSGPELDGFPLVCGPGPVGLAVKRLDLSSDWKRLYLLDRVKPQPKTAAFSLHLEQGERELSFGQPVCFSAEQGRIAGRPLGGFVAEGAAPGAHSWAAMGGQLNVQNYAMGPEATIETWFKLAEVPEQGLPLVQLVFDGSTQDSAWSGRERGGPMVFHYPDSSLGLHFHEFGDITFDIPYVFHLNEWTHLAWVRQGKRHTIYVNGRSVISFEMPRYGERTLHGVQLTLGQNADHDWITTPGRVYALFDCLKVTDKALTPEEYVDPQALAPPFIFPQGENPFSPSGLYLPVTIAGEGIKHLEIKVFDKEDNELFVLHRCDIKPGKYTLQFGDKVYERFNDAGVHFVRCYVDGEMILQKKWVILK